MVQPLWPCGRTSSTARIFSELQHFFTTIKSFGIDTIFLFCREKKGSEIPEETPLPLDICFWKSHHRGSRIACKCTEKAASKWNDFSKNFWLWKIFRLFWLCAYNLKILNNIRKTANHLINQKNLELFTAIRCLPLSNSFSWRKRLLSSLLP